MSTMLPEAEGGPGQRNVEIGVAVAIALFGVVAMIGSWKVGIGWGSDGPGAGFFPFYVGLVIVGSSCVNLAKIFSTVDPDALFARWGQLRSVLSVVIPTAVYVAALPFIGIYIASALLIAGFMTWIGRYRWAITLAVAIGVPLVTYVMFEKWFLVPLPKGPVEDWLGL